MGTKKYTKTAWINGSAPAVSATNLLNIENGIEGANGIDSLKNLSTGLRNTAIGDYSAQALTIGNDSIAIGYNALYTSTSSITNIAIGNYAIEKANSIFAFGNTAIGHKALQELTIGDSNCSFGRESLNKNTAGYNNSAFGYQASFSNTGGAENTSFGYFALYATTASTCSVAVGNFSLDSQTTGYLNTAIGYDSLRNVTTFYNCTGLGANTEVTANNQVQLGNGLTTTYAYGAVQNRSDERDKTDIKDTEIGLEFIKQLRPVDYRWNYREDYKEIITIENEDGTREKQTITHENDGSKKRTRFHHGLIAQEVKQVADTLGVDFGGYQDHKIAGGEDVLSIGYTELIAPMIKAIQQLNAKIELLESKLGGA